MIIYLSLVERVVSPTGILPSTPFTSYLDQTIPSSQNHTVSLNWKTFSLRELLFVKYNVEITLFVITQKEGKMNEEKKQGSLNECNIRLSPHTRKRNSFSDYDNDEVTNTYLIRKNSNYNISLVKIISRKMREFLHFIDEYQHSEQGA